MRKLALALLALGALGAEAAVTVTVTQVRQRFPWNGCVDVDYVIAGYPASGAGSEPSDYTLGLCFKATIDGVERVIVPTNFVSHAVCDLPTGVGTNRATWNAIADGWRFKADDLSAAATLTYAPVTEDEADVMIVDISGGPSAVEVLEDDGGLLVIHEPPRHVTGVGVDRIGDGHDVPEEGFLYCHV